MDMTALTLFGRARYKVLASLFRLRETESIHLRELARRTGLSPTAAQYELRRLLQTGLILQDGSAARPIYRINKRHPVSVELRGMIRKMDAARESEAITDDSHWAKKRVAQKGDHASRDLQRKSPFLADRKFASSLSANLQKDVSYDY